MNVAIARHYGELSREAARLVAKQIGEKPDSVLGLPTGSTPMGLYRELVILHREKGLDFSRVTTFNLDEYYGLPQYHPQSYRHFMEKHFFGHVNISSEQIHIPNGLARDITEECRAYEDAIARAGGIDILVLGIGRNGHIGFNEPGTSFDSRTRLVELAAETITANARFFSHPEDVPRRAISIGIQTVMEARKVLLLASGEDKAQAVAAALRGPVTTDVPASILQRHPGLFVIVDVLAEKDLAGLNMVELLANR